jgi:hypothetical protein
MIAIGESGGVGIHRMEDGLASTRGFAHQTAQKRILVVRIQCRDGSGELLGAVLVRPFELLAETPQKPRDCSVFRKWIKRVDQLRMLVFHDFAELRLENFD